MNPDIYDQDALSASPSPFFVW